MSCEELSYEELEKKRASLYKKIEMIYDTAYGDAQKMYGDIGEWASSQQTNTMMSEFIDSERLLDLENKYDKINEAMVSIAC